MHKNINIQHIMKTNKTDRKNWTKPEIKVLNIKKDTFSGSGASNEKGTSSDTKYP